jgi:hypothetical protein
LGGVCARKAQILACIGLSHNMLCFCVDIAPQGVLDSSLGLAGEVNS